MNELITKEEAIAIREIDGHVTMSSLRIAEITGKAHNNVLRDIEVILDEVDSNPIKALKLKFEFAYSVTDKMGRVKTHKHYLLPEREFNLVVSGYSAKYRLKLIDELLSYRKNEPALVKELTDIELLAIATDRLRISHDRTIKVEKLLAQSEIISEATKYSDKTYAIGEFCKIVSSKIEGTTLGLNTCYTILRSMKLVEKSSTRPTQKGMKIYLDYRSHDRGFSSRIHIDKADQLIKYMIRHLQQNPELNSSLGFPLGKF